MIPKIIWTYWHSLEQMPEFVQKCISSWYLYCSDYKINVVTSKTLSKYVGFQETYKIKNWKFMDSAQRMSDLVRLALLSKYGGIWLDASCVLYESLDWVNEFRTDVVMYKIPEVLTPESWFIACTRENEYIQRVNKEFREEIPKLNSINDYLKTIDTKGIEFDLNYLLIYLVLNKFLTGKECLLNASKGPYLYQTYMEDLNSIAYMKTRPKFFKFRKDEREKMTEEIENSIFLKCNCI